MICTNETFFNSKTYFANSAKLKRKIENIAVDIFYKNNFDEIINPLFSSCQSLSIEDERELIKLIDTNNNNISLRADSTLDIVKFIKTRALDTKKQNKWFYIQAVYKYPLKTINQIGAELIDEVNVEKVLKLSIEIFKALNIKPLVQISNIKIPQIIAKDLKIDLEVFKHTKIEYLLDKNISWLKELIYLENISQISDKTPNAIKDELKKLKKLKDTISYPNVIITPLYYAKMKYYNDLFFSFIQDKSTYCNGGVYETNYGNSTGFAIYTDNILEKLTKQEEYES